MRGSDQQTGPLFSYVNLEERVPARHPLRKIKTVVDAALASLDADFERLYVSEGRPSIAPERLLRASLVQILFSIRSERQLMEQLEYNLLFRWFVGLAIDEPVWVSTVFTKNRDRLLTTEMSKKLMAAILAHEKVAPLLSDEHFSVDGTADGDAVFAALQVAGQLSRRQQPWQLRQIVGRHGQRELGAAAVEAAQHGFS